jgi:RNA polymerase sigma-70 factor, ECF subfamily
MGALSGPGTSAAVEVEGDEALVARAVAGDTAAFATLVERYSRRVHALTYRLLDEAGAAEDAAQETFVRAYVRLSTYRPGTRFASWLLAIAANWCIDQRRKQRRARVTALRAAHAWLPDTTTEGDPEASTLAADQRRLVGTWVGALPPEQRRVVVLRHRDGLSYDAIARQLGEPVSTVRMRLHRARLRLAQAGHPEQAPPS